MNFIIKVLLIFIVLFTIQCKKEEYPPICPNGDCHSSIKLDYPRDSNGYYHVPIIYQYQRITIYAESSDMSEFWKYNGTANIEAHFDTDTYWLIDTIVARIPLYNPFTSIYSSPNFNSPMKIGDKEIILSQFRNTMVPIVTESGTRFMEYYPGDRFKPASEYKPSFGNLWTKQFMGPLLLGMKGDTASIYLDTGFDGELHLYSNAKVIFE